MSTEVWVIIKATFSTTEAAETAASQLKRSLAEQGGELTQALNTLQATAQPPSGPEESLTIEHVERKKNVLSIAGYTYTSEPPVWFTAALHPLGAQKIHIRDQWDEGGSHYYFLEGQRVSKRKFEGDKPKRPLSARDIEINKNLFLPEGRVHIKATLTQHWPVGDIYESILLEFMSDDNQRFYHKATGRLKQITYEGSPTTCEFSAIFERGKHDGQYVSFAKRPTKIKIGP